MLSIKNAFTLLIFHNTIKYKEINMKEYFKKLKISSLVLSILYIAFGIVLLAQPNIAKVSIVYVFGSILLVVGINNIINYFIYGYEPFGFVFGVLNAVLGIVFITTAHTIASGVFFAFAFGLIFIIKGLFGIENSLDYKRAGDEIWWLHSIFATVALLFGVIILCSPTAEKLLTILIGIVLLIIGVTNIISIFVIAKNLNKTKRTIQTVIYIDEDKTKTENKDNKNSKK